VGDGVGVGDGEGVGEGLGIGVYFCQINFLPDNLQINFSLEIVVILPLDVQDLPRDVVAAIEL
jgi:hypothetical protein